MSIAAPGPHLPETKRRWLFFHFPLFLLLVCLVDQGSNSFLVPLTDFFIPLLNLFKDTT